MLLSKMASMFRTDRLTDWLPYLAYDEDRDLYVNADGTFGFIQEIAPVMFAGWNKNGRQTLSSRSFCMPTPI